MERPQYTEANALLVQVKFNGTWGDYASVKNRSDLDYACRLVEMNHGEYRIVCQRVGGEVVYCLSDLS